MSLSIRPPALSRLRDERGFTLIELLVALITSVVVSGAALSILNISMGQTSRIADRVSANQRGRIAMEKIMLELHSSCVAPKTTPVEPGSEENKVLIVSDTGSEPSFATVELHKIYLEEEKEKEKYKLVDASYLNTGAKQAPEWEFSGIASNTQTLLTGVSRSINRETKKAIPVFQYYKYEGSKLSETPLSGELKEPLASEVAAITVSFTTAPSSKAKDKREGERSVNLSDTAVLRFSPATTSGVNFPCA
jgi:prepilin-type N-terminal cleavage/methylation domain-containing protein